MLLERGPPNACGSCKSKQWSQIPKEMDSKSGAKLKALRRRLLKDPNIIREHNRLGDYAVIKEYQFKKI